MEWPFRRENSNIRSRILDGGASLRIYGLSQKSNDFASYIRQIPEKVMFSLHTFKKFGFGALEIDTPIEDAKWSGRFVQRI